MNLAITLTSASLGAFAAASPVDTLIETFRPYPPVASFRDRPRARRLQPRKAFFKVARANRTLIDTSTKLTADQWREARTAGFIQAVEACQGTAYFQNATTTLSRMEFITLIAEVFTARPDSVKRRFQVRGTLVESAMWMVGKGPFVQLPTPTLVLLDEPSPDLLAEAPIQT